MRPNSPVRVPNPKVAVTRELPDSVMERLETLFEASNNRSDRAMSRDELATAMATCDVLVPTVTDMIDAALIEGAGDRLKLIANFGAGVNHIDLAAARRRGIIVTNTPGVLTEDTADMTMALILSVPRRLAEGEKLVRSGQWRGWSPSGMLGHRIGGKKLGTKQLTLFTRQLSSLIQVSPLEEALRTVSRQNEKEHVRDILSNVHSGVLEGQRLSEAMKREPKSFPPLFRAMVSAGETSGSLPQITERLANLLERQAEMRGKLIGALAYPIVLAIVAMLVVVGLMVSVVPRVVEQFDNVEQQLPLITRIVIGISSFLAAYWWVLALLMQPQLQHN